MSPTSKNAQESPVHDCLIVKATNKYVAVDALQEAMAARLGFAAALDVSWIGDGGVLCSEIILDERHQPTGWKAETTPEFEVITGNDDDDDFEVIEDI